MNSFSACLLRLDLPLLKSDPPDLNLLSGQLTSSPASVRDQARKFLTHWPEDPRVRLILASAERRLGNNTQALALLEPLATAFPNAAMTRFELGVVLAALGQSQNAEVHLSQATRLNPDLAEAWKALGEIWFAKGQDLQAQSAFANYGIALLSLPELKQAAKDIQSGQTEVAHQCLRGLLANQPHNADGWHLFAKCLLSEHRLEDARLAIDRCLEIEPDFDGARLTFATILFESQHGPEAVTQLEQLLTKAPNEPAYLNLLAASCALCGDYERAFELYENLLERFPRHPRLWLNYGHALRTTRRQTEAIAAYRRCTELAPNLGEAFWSLANLKVARFTPDDLARMNAQLESKTLSQADRTHFHFALGKAFEDANEPEQAFVQYQAGSGLRSAQLKHDPLDNTTLFKACEATFTADFWAQRQAWGCPASDPIFIVGLPRSGSTLLEQILASHSLVEGTMELSDLGQIAATLTRPSSPYPVQLAQLNETEIRILGEAYIERTRRYRRTDRPHFIDKMPNNFRYGGLIKLILPNARIIDARRHPMASGFSAFKQLFAHGQGFSYDLGHIGAYYTHYTQMMSQLDASHPGAAHRVIYEDLVESLEDQVRRLLAYCGLDFESACLRFHHNDRAVRTVSSEQVRQPLFRDGLDHWRAFAPYLGQLEIALGPTLGNWRD